jgi:hypothetical protein
MPGLRFIFFRLNFLLLSKGRLRLIGVGGTLWIFGRVSSSR